MSLYLEFNGWCRDQGLGFRVLGLGLGVRVESNS